MLELEGTWEEIAAHAAELAGHRVRLTVLDGNEAGTDTSAAAKAFAGAIKDLEEWDADLPLAASSDTVRIIREGRAGAMYGYDPYD